MWYWMLRGILIALGKTFFSVKTEGLENLPATNFIIVSNHASFLDPLLIMAVVPKKVFCIALKDIYKFTWMRWFLIMTETLPCGSASQKAAKLLEKNMNIGLFPEGGVSRDGSLKEFRRGAALLAYKTGRPIVPAAVFGTYESLPFGKRIPKPMPLKVKIGKPIYLLKESEEIIDDVNLQKGILRLRNEVRSLLNAG